MIRAFKGRTLASPFNTKQLVTQTYQMSLHMRITNFITQKSWATRGGKKERHYNYMLLIKKIPIKINKIKTIKITP